jgi:aminomethyltransferase
MLKQTPLIENHKRLKARLVDFGGWELPVQYDGIVAEHQRVRNEAGMFDTCHMNSIRISGDGALDFLSHVFSGDLRSLADGRCRYGFLLREDAGVLDDLIVYRLSAAEWMAVVNAGPSESDYAWLASHLPANGVELTDLRGVQGKIDVQGPKCLAAVEKVLGTSLADLGFFRVRPFGQKGLVSRTGYTGEFGFEIFAPVEDSPGMWDKLLAEGVKPAGLGARDTLRLEAGLPLYGHELSTDVSPFEAGMMRFAGKEEDFIGRAALIERAKNSTSLRLIPFKIDGRQSARNGQKVLDNNGNEAGYVTSGSFAPTLNHSIGFAYVRPDLTEVDTELKIDSGRREPLAAKVTVAPFYKRSGN